MYHGFPPVHCIPGAVLQLLDLCDALWAALGSSYVSMEGALRGIQFARERDRPFSAPEAVSNILW